MDPQNEKKSNPLIVCLIAFLGRADLVKCNVALLKQQSLPVKTLLVGSTEKDHQTATEAGADYYLHFANRPLGRKWQAGLSKIPEVFPDVSAVLINGSDDFLSPHYAARAYKYIEKGYDLVGKKDWYLYDGKIKNGYYLKKNIYSVLGAGRMWSRRFLDLAGWELFPKKANNQLDSTSYKRLVALKGKYGTIKNPGMVILSIKGKHGVLSTTQAIVRDRKALAVDVDGQGKILVELYDLYLEKDYSGVAEKMIELENLR